MKWVRSVVTLLMGLVTVQGAATVGLRMLDECVVQRHSISLADILEVNTRIDYLVKRGVKVMVNSMRIRFATSTRRYETSMRSTPPTDNCRQLKTLTKVASFMGGVCRTISLDDKGIIGDPADPSLSPSRAWAEWHAGREDSPRQAPSESAT